MNSYDDEERERPSWSEIDKRKDQSRHVSAERAQPKKSRLHTWAARQYRKELERLWMGKKGTEECRKALGEIHKRHGTPKFHTTVKAFIKEYGLPDDWETLFLLLDYRDVDTVREVMEKLKDLYPEKGLTEMQGFRAKLDIMASTAGNEKLRESARTVLIELQ
ncbi:MAG TPA: hypothetical protein PKM59_07095 [Thermodesulfobacteriota bacterium]|nr:hypothetical protein [Deltaproteobacteria bacterium]HNR13058.1 hypothetical protein [Thermodesulfobacteriota bacterium]HNU70511.1 hypothetical protein [Thermodesulfobacteriota bacterium]